MCTGENLTCLNKHHRFHSLEHEGRFPGKLAWRWSTAQCKVNRAVSYYGNLILLPPSLRVCTFKLGVLLLDFYEGLAAGEEAF